MNEQFYMMIGLSFPFFMNALGAFFIFFTPEIKQKGVLDGLSAGIMTSACIWSLIIPAINLSSHLGAFAFLPACIGLAFGAVLIYFSDLLLKKRIKRNDLNKLFWAITLHNIPEGLAVGFAFGSNGLNVINALSVAFGIGVQNMPEGLAVALAYKSGGKNKLKSFCYGAISGTVEPISALIGALLVNFISFLQPYILALSAGAMIYVIVEELIPKSVQSKRGVWGFIGGFCLMMALDLALS
ncbi:MAG: ZIP family metal transporter [Clostridia bacterium]|nr:ZIP family metal transporter [Clostridia bacterium]